MLRQHGVTPARFDALHCIAKYGGVMAQGALRRMLGVVRSTVCETLKKLEELGLVRRGKRVRAGRLVTLTQQARRVLFDAWGEQCVLEVDLAHAFHDSEDDPVHQLELERLCAAARAAFDDDGPPLLYDWLEYVD